MGLRQKVSGAVYFIKIGVILDFDPLYKFDMTFDL